MLDFSGRGEGDPNPNLSCNFSALARTFSIEGKGVIS